MQASIAGAQPQHNKSLVGGTVSAFRPEKKWTHSHTLGPPPQKEMARPTIDRAPKPQLGPPPPPRALEVIPTPKTAKKSKLGCQR